MFKKVLKRCCALLMTFVMTTTLFCGITFVETSAATNENAVKAELSGKKILFCGDSIAAGWRDDDNGGAYRNSSEIANGRGWSRRIGFDYSAVVTNAAVAGQALSTCRESEDKSPIVQQLHNNKSNSYDYVLLEGGFNDAMGCNSPNNTKEYAAPVGTTDINEWNTDNFDTSTFAGALENLFAYATAYFPAAKIGFIITYATPRSTYGGYTAEVEEMRKYWNMAKKICDKWDIKYIDLFDGKNSDGKTYSYDILKTDTATDYFPGGTDQIHLNSAGYDIITPYIADFLANDVTVPSKHDSDTLFTLDFENTYTYTDGNTYYDETSYYNWSAANNRGSNAEHATENDGNHAVRLTYDSGNNNENYNANAGMNIYNPATKSRFTGVAGITYAISFDYKVEETDNKSLQLFVAPCNRIETRNAFNSTDLGTKPLIVNEKLETPVNTEFTAATEKITEKSDKWATAMVYYTAQDKLYGAEVFPIIILQTNNKTKDSNHTGAYASILIDNIRVTYSENTLDFESSYTDSDGNAYYDFASADNWSASNNRGSNAAIVTESDTNHAVRLTYDSENGNENYNANAVLNIYNPETKSKFIGTVGITYAISFDYKVEETDGKSLQLFVSPSNRDKAVNKANYSGTDMGPKAVIVNENGTAVTNSGVEYIAVTDKITQKSTGWTTVTVYYTAQGESYGAAVYPIIILQTNDKTKDSNHTGSYASVLIDNIKIRKSAQVSVIFHNYDDGDKTMKVDERAVFSDLEIPSKKGYKFEGWYTDSELKNKADDAAIVKEYKNVYIKWSGDGNAITPVKNTETFTAETKRIVYGSKFKTDGSGNYVVNSMIDMPGSISMDNYYGSIVFTGDTVSESPEIMSVDSIFTKCGANSVIFYVELPDFEKSGAEWGLALAPKDTEENGIYGICAYTPEKTIDWQKWNWYTPDGKDKFEYAQDGEWIESSISEKGVFTGLPSGFKGYIRLDYSELNYSGFSLDTNQEIQLSALKLCFNAFGGKNGDAVLGEILYFPETKSESTVMKIGDVSYELSKSSEAITVNSYAVKGNTDCGFSTRYGGTEGTAAVKYITDTQSSAPYGESSAVITTDSGKAESTVGYMTTYYNGNTDIMIQPGVDTVMFYVEMPEFTVRNTSAGLKILDMCLKQGGKTATLSFSNSIYQYADVNGASWKTARAGADGDLYDIPSGFKGYIKLNIKYFKNFADLLAEKAIDFNSLYYITGFEIGFNHIGGDNGNIVIGGVYSVINDSAAPFVIDGMTLDKFCFKVIAGDFDCDGNYSIEDMILIKKKLLGVFKSDNAAANLRGKNVSILTLIHAKKVIAGVASTDLSVSCDSGLAYKDIFTDDIGTKSVEYYDIKKTETEYDKIEADTALNSADNAVRFANDITENFVGDFEKVGIDKMCHVSTFLYANGNIYVSYYANTILAGEDPQYQVARFAYAPENNTANKVIIDIMQVGDDLYGHKVTGVYDTILMKKENDPLIYILWTASIKGKYYRLYRTFDPEKEELGEIGVNRFKVGNVTNDFSESGMKKALAENDIKAKVFFADIGIMQKLSTRVENGETYYYSGAYSGNFTCIIKSKDLITWEYVAQPNSGANNTGFENATKWENAVYVLGYKVYYFVRQWDPGTGNGAGSAYGILTSYDLTTGEWAKPVLVGDCQSRSDFIVYKDNLYLFYAPTDREHIGILQIDIENLQNSKVVLQANMGGSCFYPFVQYNSRGELCMSYTVSRKHIRMASFKLSDYLD